jgi:hypothetical protein
LISERANRPFGMPLFSEQNTSEAAIMDVSGCTKRAVRETLVSFMMDMQKPDVICRRTRPYLKSRRRCYAPPDTRTRWATMCSYAAHIAGIESGGRANQPFCCLGVGVGVVLAFCGCEKI